MSGDRGAGRGSRLLGLLACLTHLKVLEDTDGAPTRTLSPELLVLGGRGLWLSAGVCGWAGRWWVRWAAVQMAGKGVKPLEPPDKVN